MTTHRPYYRPDRDFTDAAIEVAKDTGRHALRELRLGNVTGAKYYGAILSAQVGLARATALLGVHAAEILH